MEPQIKAALLAAALEAADRGDHEKLALLVQLANNPEMAEQIVEEANQINTMSEEPTRDASAYFLG